MIPWPKPSEGKPSVEDCVLYCFMQKCRQTRSTRPQQPCAPKKAGKGAGRECRSGQTVRERHHVLRWRVVVPGCLCQIERPRLIAVLPLESIKAMVGRSIWDSASRCSFSVSPFACCPSCCPLALEPLECCAKLCWIPRRIGSGVIIGARFGSERLRKDQTIRMVATPVGG